MYHTPVLLKESIDALAIETKANGLFIDATLGGGGHTREILKRLGEEGTLVVFDKDSDAISNVPEDGRVIVVRNNFRFLQNCITLLCHKNIRDSGLRKSQKKLPGDKVQVVDGIIADLGVSSHQFDTGSRGFSYRFDAPLDMRMNTLSGQTAADILNAYDKEALRRIFADYGELPEAQKIATLICKSGTIKTTGELAKVLSPLYNIKSEKKFLGKVFQALRIEVNNEMAALEDMLEGAANVLAPGGRLSVITYHSLEDRIVKNFFRDKKEEGIFSIVNKKPILPAEEEMLENARSRSAKLRVAERC